MPAEAIMVQAAQTRSRQLGGGRNGRAGAIRVGLLGTLAVALLPAAESGSVAPWAGSGAPVIASPAPPSAPGTVPVPAPAAPAAPAVPAARPAPATGDASGVDAATRARAEAAADQIEAKPAAADPVAQRSVDEADALMLQADALLDAGQTMAAGDAFLAAQRHLASVPQAARAGLRAHYQRSEDHLLALSQRLLRTAPPGDAAGPPPGPVTPPSAAR
jgi:hypothetical protein